MGELVQFPRQPPGYFGGCPVCGGDDGYLNIRREHWFHCRRHCVKWCAGENLFSGWREEDEAVWQENVKTLFGYRVAEPVYSGLARVPSLRTDQYPVVRRFYQASPPRHIKHVTQLYDAIEAATQARRTMSSMDRKFRPDLATELENARENLEYRQLSKADQAMRGISAEMRLVGNARDLDTLREYTRSLERDRKLKTKVARIRNSKSWRNLGDLKRDLLDMWIQSRNANAKAVMMEIDQDRRAAQ